MHCVLHGPCPVTIVRPGQHPGEELSPPVSATTSR
jgi:hypothetical protein